jgi:hypothetical protein
VTVGRAFGRLPHELRDVPLHWLVWDYLSLREVMYVDELIAERDRIREGVLSVYAFHEPKRIDAENEKLKARVRAYWRCEPEPRERTNAELREYARRMHADIMARGVLDDTPKPVS